MQSAIGTRLSAMMFLQFFIWGAWYVTIGNYMAAQGMADLTHWPYTVNPVAAIVAPFFLGLVADRFFATERVLGTLHIIGGLIMLTVPQAAGSPLLFILLLLLYNICYMPTLGLANSLAFHNIRNQERQFPAHSRVRHDRLDRRRAVHRIRPRPVLGRRIAGSHPRCPCTPRRSRA